MLQLKDFMPVNFLKKEKYTGSCKGMRFRMEKFENEKYISIDEAAEYLGIKPVTLRSWIRNPKNEVPAHKIGRFWKFKCSEIDAWVQSGKSAIDDGTGL